MLDRNLDQDRMKHDCGSWFRSGNHQHGCQQRRTRLDSNLNTTVYASPLCQIQVKIQRDQSLDPVLES